MKDIAVVYDLARDLVMVRVPHAVTSGQLKLVADMAANIDRGRMIAARGDARDILAKKIKAIEAGRYRQVVVNPRGDADLFKATRGTGKIISLGVTT